MPFLNFNSLARVRVIYYKFALNEEFASALFSCIIFKTVLEQPIEF